METFEVYKDIQARTKGSLYLGIIGPVRTGKSTFIKRFMDLMVLPNMTDEPDKVRTRDELPQSAAGKTIMTTEPKFIPKEAAKIILGGDTAINVRLIDCVGYMVEGASGHIENQAERMVKTPWYDYEIPFTQAAELGTRKVIHDHATIGIVVTTDGSFGELKRESYIPAEERTVGELKTIGKPFVVILNSARPFGEDTRALAEQMREKYKVSVISMNCEQLKKEDITKLLEEVLSEFQVTELDFFIPKWIEILPVTHPLKAALIGEIKAILAGVTYMKDTAKTGFETHGSGIRAMKIGKKDLSTGRVSVDVEMEPGLYYETLSDVTGLPIHSEYELMRTIAEFARAREEYTKVQSALEAVRMKGYGVVMPNRSEIQLEEPTLIRHGNKYGVKMRAQAPAVNMIKANIETEIAPIVGEERQAEDLIAYIKANGESADGIWSTNIFGKSIEQIVEDGMHAKVAQMTDDCQLKLQDTLQKIINDSNGGMICIII